MIDIQYNKIRLISFALIIFAIDQFTKTIALHMLDFDKEFKVNKYISLHRIFNQNTFMLNYTLPIGIEAYKLLWICIALIIILGIFWVTNMPALKENTLETEFARTGLFILFGAGLGNAYDVIFRYDGVIDFLRLNFQENIPILNFADIMIYFGNMCLIITWFLIIKNGIIKKFNK